ncbi:hypothetical protein D3C86_624920 [compost metagenome]
MRRAFPFVLALMLAVPPSSQASEPMRREVILLINAEMAQDLQGESVPKAVETVLNHLGLIARYHDASHGLPEAGLSRRALGVITLVDGDRMPHARRYADWFKQRLQARQKVAFLSGLGLTEDSLTGEELPQETWKDVFREFGLQVKLDFLGDPRAIAVAERHDATRFEEDWNAPLRIYRQAQNRDPRNTVFLKLKRQDNGETSDVGMVGPQGAVILHRDYLVNVNPVSHRLRWKVDPFWLLSRAFDLDGKPRLDTTTVNGRRIFYAHIDGDGFANVAPKPGRPYAAEVVRDEVLSKTPLPTTVSVISGEILGKPKLEAIARSIFRLSNVRAASHSSSHPHDWETGSITTNGTSDADANAVATRYETLSPTHEIDGSVNAIGTLLPPGRRVEIMLWSGRTNPTEPFLQRTTALGIPNMNGGDAILNRFSPSYANLSPLGRQVGPYLQVYSSAANENLFSNLWTGPFDGQLAARDLFEFTESPRRMAPVNIYYHFYAGERLGGLNALKTLYRWAESQPLTALHAAQYARIVEGFHGGSLTQLAPDSWRLSGTGTLRTLRFDNESRMPDLARSTGVAGFTHANGALYVHLTASDAVVALTTSRPDRPYLKEAAAPLDAWQMEGNRLVARFDAAAPMEVVLAGFTPGQAVRIAGDLTGKPVADARGELRLSAAASGLHRLEASW